MNIYSAQNIKAWIKLRQCLLDINLKYQLRIQYYLLLMVPLFLFCLLQITVFLIFDWEIGDVNTCTIGFAIFDFFLILVLIMKALVSALRVNELTITHKKILLGIKDEVFMLRI